jgi:DNA-binding response OmpR family regulator
MKLLIIEDELPMRTALCGTLAADGYKVRSAANGETGLARALGEEHDLILLDVMMPKLDGYALCRELRRRGRKTPVLMLTAKGMVDDRVEGLDAGADDYLVKPFAMRELLARVRALLRRTERESSAPDSLTLGDTVIDFTKQTAFRGTMALELSHKEFAMLRLLASRRGEAVSREQFLDEVWEYNAWPTTRTVDNFIATLRSRLEPNPDQPRFIETVRGTGYRLNAPASGEPA